MSKKESTTMTEGAIGEIAQGPSAFEQFLDRNQKYLFLFGILLLVTAVGYLVVRSINDNREAAAGAALMESAQKSSLQELIAQYDGTPASGSALLLLAQKQFENAETSAALSTLQGFLADYPDHPGTGKGKLLLSQYYAAEGDSDRAKDTLITLLEEGDPTYSPAAKLFLAELQFPVEQAEAANLLTEIITLDEETAGNLIPIAEARKRIMGSTSPPVVEPPQEEEKTPESEASSRDTPAPPSDLPSSDAPPTPEASEASESSPAATPPTGESSQQ